MVFDLGEAGRSMDNRFVMRLILDKIEAVALGPPIQTVVSGMTLLVLKRSNVLCSASQSSLSLPGGALGTA